MLPPRIKRLFTFTGRSREDIRKDVEDELAFHLESRSTDLESQGIEPAAARERAARELGNLARASAALRQMDERSDRQRGIGRIVSELGQDASYGLRLLFRNRGFAVTAILTLAVAIGGNVALFSIINALFLRPLDIRDPSRLVRIHTGQSRTSWPNVEDIRRRSTAFSDVIAQRDTVLSMAVDGEPAPVTAGVVSDNYFSALGVLPLAGRPFQPGEPRRDVVVLGARLWESQFGGSPLAVGRRVTLDGRSYEVVAVVPRSFRSISPLGFSPDLWVPVGADDAAAGLTSDRGAARFEVFGRLQPGISVAAAQASTRVVGARLAQEYPDVDAGFRDLDVYPAGGLNLYRGMGKTLLPVFAFVGFATVLGGLVLLMSCANLAGLLLGRAAARRQEIAIRVALGAGRGRLVRQLLTESLLLAALGGIAGLVLASWLTRGLAVLSRQPSLFPIQLNLTPDVRVLGYTALVSLGAALLAGLAPARRASQPSCSSGLRMDGIGPSRQRVRQALVVIQVTGSTVLLFWSGLFAQSLAHASGIDPGFDTTDVLVVDVPMAPVAPASGQRPGPAPKTDATLVDLAQRISSLPGVQQAGWSSVVPLTMTSNERFRAARGEAPAAETGDVVNVNYIGPGWLEALRIPVRAGRAFTWNDRQGSPSVVLVNETLAARFWNGAAVGRMLRMGSQTAEVVGVVRDTKYWSIGEAIAPQVYIPFRQAGGDRGLTLIVRSSDPRSASGRIRAEVAAATTGRIARIRPMAEAVSISVMPARVAAFVTGGFGLLGASLATLGVYGLIAFIVVQRTREVAIRRAIGARTFDILRLIAGGSLGMAAAGLIPGLALAMLSAPLLGGLLVNVSPRDPLLALATAAVVFGAAVLACLRPTLRAMRLDPLAALKAD